MNPTASTPAPPPGPASAPPSPLSRFSPATRAWFESSFTAPTAAQAGAWEAITTGRHALVVAPTGSGKTLAAFLWALDRIGAQERPAHRLRRCRVLYVSPMKALAVDVERNLRSPLVGIQHAAARLGVTIPEISVSVRSGDTPPEQRRAFARSPSDVLITTPESLFLLLTSAAREALTGVETVILDEVHAVAGTKRGAHLALSLERLDALLERPAQRVGLSATVRPVEEVARFLAGGRPVSIVQPESAKQWELEVVVPVPDMADLDRSPVPSPGSPDGLADAAPGPRERASIWPHVEERIVDLVAAHRSTIIFANSRRLAERLTARLNELWEERLDAAGDGPPPSSQAPLQPAGTGPQSAGRGPQRTGTEPQFAGAGPQPAGEGHAGTRHPRAEHAPPAQVMAQSGASHGAPAILARAHHGSVSREQRLEIEEALKSGLLPAVVATSSLELGIDMGAVDLVIQVESPPSVASGLQRVGRAGHQVGAVSKGVLFPKFRGDLVQTAVVVERMRTGAIEELRVPANPLDVLAQQIVAMCALDDWPVATLHELVRRSAPYAALSRAVLEAVLDMLAGRYPSEEFAELRPRIVWDRMADQISGRRGAQRLAVTSGGTIPDRGLYAVFLATGDGPGRRVGELDEEMVYESRVGDMFTLGTSTWRIEEITHDRVLVTPAPGLPGRLPFWKGDQQGRPAELGRAVGAFVREVSGLPPERARERVQAAGLDAWASDNLVGYLAEQQAATDHVPSDRLIVVERFRDELGDWRVAIHSPFGAPVHAPWALAVAARMRERFGVEVQAMHGDDGIVLRLPDVSLEEDLAVPAADLLDLVRLDPDEVRGLVTDELGGSALFAARFRECASRALLLPRRHPGRRQPLWQQRQRSAQLLQVAAGYPDFPIVLETVRECIQDVFDVPGLERLMRDIDARVVSLVDVESAQPSPFAQSLLFGYVAQYLYEGDSPLAERRAAALSLDPGLLAELVGGGDAPALRDLLDADAIARTEAELQHLTPERAARDPDEVGDLLRVLGPLTTDAVTQRCAGHSDTEVAAWLEGLEAARRVIRVRIGGVAHWAAVEDAARLRDALGVSLPVGLPAAFLEPVADPLADLLARHARTHGPFPAAQVATRFALGSAVVLHALRALVGRGRLVEGELLPTSGGGAEFCDADVLRRIRRRSLAALRAEVEAVPPKAFAAFLPQWQGVGARMRGREGLLRVVEQLSGVPLPASAWESLVLPARVVDYAPGLLDEVMSSGEVLWCGHGALAGDDGWVSLHVAETAPLTLPVPSATAEPVLVESGLVESGLVESGLLAAFETGGAFHFRALAERMPDIEDAEVLRALWSLVWSGRVVGDTFAPVRGLLGGGRTSHKPRQRPPRLSRYAIRHGTLAGRGVGLRADAAPAPPTGVGRWSLLPAVETDPTIRAHAWAELLLDRYGVLTRGSVVAEDLPGGFAATYRVLAAAEEAGRVRRGYFIEGLGASQFGSTGAVDRLRRAGRAESGDGGALVLAASDPANPYGAALPWPAHTTGDWGDDSVPGQPRRGHQPARKAGALVVIVDGALVLYLERGGRTLLSWSDDPVVLGLAARAVAAAVQAGSLGRLTIEKVDGSAVLGSRHPLAVALAEAGFHLTPRGLRLRR